MPQTPVLVSLARLRPSLTNESTPPVQAAVKALADAMEEAARQLVFAADMQSYYDARETSTTYQKALGQLMDAASHLTPGCPPLSTRPKGRH